MLKSHSAARTISNRVGAFLSLEDVSETRRRCTNLELAQRGFDEEDLDLIWIIAGGGQLVQADDLLIRQPRLCGLHMYMSCIWPAHVYVMHMYMPCICQPRLCGLQHTQQHTQCMDQ